MPFLKLEQQAISLAVAEDLDLQNIQEAHQEAQEKVGPF